MYSSQSLEAPLNVLILKPWGGARTGTSDAADARPALTRSLTMLVMSSAVRMGEGVEEAMLLEALEEAEVAVAEGADDDGSLVGGFHTP